MFVALCHYCWIFQRVFLIVLNIDQLNKFVVWKPYFYFVYLFIFDQQGDIVEAYADELISHFL